MSEYSSDINTDLYDYRQPVYVSEVTGQNQNFIPLKLNLNGDNFNFDLARADGADFRLAENSNGTGVLKMWTAYWNSTTRKATVWFKLPELLASETRTLYAFWGFGYDSGISELESMLGNPGTPVFLFGDDFDTPLDTLVNLCLGDTGTAFADSYYNSSYSPDKAFDGDSGTRWNSVDAGVSVPCYIGYGFHVPTIIDRVSIEFNNTAYWINLVIEASNSQSGPYTVLYTFASTPATGSYSTHDFSNSTAYTFYRLYGTRTTNIHQGVREFEMYYKLPVKWSSTFGSYTISDSVINLGTDAWIRCEVAAPLTTVRSWIVEEGVIGVGSPTSTTIAAHRYRFYGGENVLGINYYWEGATDRQHDVLYADTYSTYNGVERGLEIGSYSHNYFGYYEPTDNVYQGMINRNSYAGYDDSWERKVHRNTELTDFSIYGEDESSANGVVIDWVIAREFTPDSDPTVNLSDLWVDHESVGHQPLDYNEYTSDVTSVDYHHSSDMGGDPYRMSDDVTSSPANVFTSDDEVTEGSIVIDFGRTENSITDNYYTHFNSDNTVEFYNASKLSDSDTDVHGRDYWATTTTSGWAAIRFPEAKNVVCLMLTAVSGSEDRMPSQFNFYGSQYDPRFDGWEEKVLIYEGYAGSSRYQQTFYFSTGLTFYKYYILEVLNTHGGNIALQEWGMYEQDGTLGKKSISQLRLHPVTLAGGEYYFPKQIKFFGSNDGFVWDTLIGSQFIEEVGGKYISYTDIALGATTDASHTQGGGNDTQHAVDGDDGTWFSTGANVDINDCWWEVDLGAEYNVGKIRVLTGNSTEEFYVTTSPDQVVWTNVYSNTPGIVEFIFYTDVDCRYLRLHFTASNNWESWAEIKSFEVYNYDEIVLAPEQIGYVATPTPFVDYAYGRWSRYSFDNTNAYYLYKLTCYNNWRAVEDIMKIAEWEMVERVEEVDNIRILSGATNNINNIWADPDTTIDNGTLYMTNELFNTVENEKLIHYVTVSGIVADFNVKL